MIPQPYEITIPPSDEPTHLFSFDLEFKEASGSNSEESSNIFPLGTKNKDMKVLKYSAMNALLDGVLFIDFDAIVSFCEFWFHEIVFFLNSNRFNTKKIVLTLAGILMLDF